MRERVTITVEYERQPTVRATPGQWRRLLFARLYDRVCGGDAGQQLRLSVHSVVVDHNGETWRQDY